MENKITKVWSHKQFKKFFQTSPRLAFEFRRDSLGDDIPVEHMTEEERKSYKPKEQKVADNMKETKAQAIAREQNEKKIDVVADIEKVEEETTQDIVSVDELSLEDMRTILGGADIKYSHLAKEKGLMKLIKENGLV